jgi:hypothetical protein
MKLVARMTGIAAICALLMAPLTTANASAAPAGSFSTPTAAAPMHPANFLGTKLTKGEWMYPGDNITSADGAFTLNMQPDGNLVEYWSDNQTRACWASNTNGHPGDFAVYQDDGNFVVYAPNGGGAHWASNTAGKAGTTVDMSTSLREYGFLYVGVTPIASTAIGTFHC